MCKRCFDESFRFILNRSISNIRGVKVGDDETKVLAYADDLTATLSDIPSVERLLAVLNAFERCSGLKMNLKKTKAMWIGANKGSSAIPLHYIWIGSLELKIWESIFHARRKRLRFTIL